MKRMLHTASLSVSYGGSPAAFGEEILGTRQLFDQLAFQLGRRFWEGACKATAWLYYQ